MIDLLFFMSAIATSCVVTSFIGLFVNLTTNWKFYTRSVKMWGALKNGDHRIVIKTHTKLHHSDDSIHKRNIPMVAMVVGEKWEVTKSSSPYHTIEYGNLSISDYNPKSADSVDVIVTNRYKRLGSPFVSIPFTFDWMLAKFDKRFEDTIVEKIDPIEKILMV